MVVIRGGLAKGQSGVPCYQLFATTNLTASA
jgi:hypothetical protein